MLLNFKKKDMLTLKIESVTIYLNNLKTKRLFAKYGNMNLKKYIPAMNKNLFFGLGFILFAALVLILNWLFRLPVNQAEKIHHQIVSAESNIMQLRAIRSEYLIGLVNENNLFAGTELKSEEEAGRLIKAVRVDLEFLGNKNRISRDNIVSSSINDFSLALDNFENNLSSFFSAIREKGNENTGLIMLWTGLSNRMLSVSNPPDEDIGNSLTRMKQLETNYRLQNDPRLLEEISRTAEEIRNRLIPEDGGISMEDLDGYMTFTGNMIALEKRIGTADTQGIVADLEQAFSDLLTSFAGLKILVGEKTDRIRAWWTFSGFLAVLLLTVFCIMLLIVITNAFISKPLLNIAGHTLRLAGGEIPPDPVVSQSLPEIRQVETNLGKLTKALQEKVDFTGSLNDGILDTTLTPAGENDALGNQLARFRQKIRETAAMQAKNDEEAMKRRYINEGLANFSAILRTSSDNITRLGDDFIRELVKYLNAIQGGFFLIDGAGDSESVLRLISAFAYNRKKYMQKTLALGEGLVGTCAIEKQSINLTEIPAGYISITSGLGDTKPDNLLLVPVMHENELIGVLEIASLYRYKEHEIFFAEQVAKSLGSTIVYTRNNQRTSELLSKSQQQALEMAEQEEEMRQNMEELKATQEESSRREEEMKGIADAIANTMFVIEYDLEGLILEVNDRVCIFLGRNREELIGKTHQQMFDGSLNPDTLFWEHIRNNNQTFAFENVRIGKKEFRLKHHFTAVLNRDGIVINYINFTADISGANNP